MPFPYLDMYALNTHPNPKHLTLQTTIHRKKKLYVLKDMGRTHDSQYSILQTSILITFKICKLKGVNGLYAMNVVLSNKISKI